MLMVRELMACRPGSDLTLCYSFQSLLAPTLILLTHGHTHIPVQPEAKDELQISYVLPSPVWGYGR